MNRGSNKLFGLAGDGAAVVLRRVGIKTVGN